MSAATAQQLYRSFLAKAGGEGSRGGKVLGHTASGAPIYQHDHRAYARIKDGHNRYQERPTGPDNSHHVAHVLKKFPAFSAQDHRDASQAHMAAGQAAHNDGHRDAGIKHYRISDAHADAAFQMRTSKK